MQIQSEPASCVLAGDLNRSILRPDWLVRSRLVDEGQADVEVMLTAGPLAFRYSIGGFRWLVETGKLTVEVLAGEANPGEMVANVIQVLKHTPVRGVGNNFNFAPDEEAGSRLQEYLGSKLSSQLADFYGGGGVATASYVAQVDTAQVRVTFESDGTRVKRILINFHRNVGDAEQAAAAARRWPQDRVAAEQLLANIRSMLR